MIGSLHLYNSGATPADGALVAGVSFGRINAGRRGALIAASQDTANGNQIGLKFYTRNLTSTANDDLNTTPALHLKPDNTVAIAASTATPALTVTQNGTGHAFVVEDAASDTTPFSIDTEGIVRLAGGETQPGGTRLAPYDYSIRVPSGGGGLSMNVLTDSNLDPASIRMFRSTNTTGNVMLQVLLGNNSTTANHSFAANNNQTSRIANNNGAVEIGNGGNTVTTVGGLVINKTAVTAPTVSDGNVFSGFYTPTLTNVTNVEASLAYQMQYIRVGNVVTVSGQIDINPTAAGNCVVRLSLPIASTFTAPRNAAGMAIGTHAARIQADTATGDAYIGFVASDLSNAGYSLSFTYRIM
jgi:hypothetical protein